MSFKTCGLNKEKRVSFLKEHGYILADQGKGSHTIWVNPEMKSVALSNHIVMPENLRSNIAQKPWEITLPCDPASGTWHTIQRQAEWCMKALEQARHLEQADVLKTSISEQFRAAKKEITEWKHTVKHCLKMGQEPPHAPACYHQRKI